MGPTLIALLTMVVLHDVDGREISVNIDQIAMLHHSSESKGKPNTMVAKGIKCVITLINGSRVSVTEDCGTVRQAIREAQK